eukprot:TRINITY_DN110846_c0_g1_i1.p1 TRINITY_DN110846_c0_g1~~TRINITY_DN110846_c0_g1_i1.p1  ORF type:complete len:164 (-),score=36.65 TRINITY_DN110846_c0_g1_i1:3-494(-)
MRVSSRLLASAVDKRAAELGLKIPAAAAPAANYLPWVRSGNLVYISGQIPKTEQNELLKGKLGQGCSLDEGKAAARLCCLHLVGQMKVACGGDLDKVKKIVRVEGFVNSSDDFGDHPAIINGCSDLLVDIFGAEVGAHSRFAVGCNSLPFGVAVEIGAIVEVE